MATSKYLLAHASDHQWGIITKTVGLQDVEPGSNYPIGEHPEDYLFFADRGRVLRILRDVTEQSGYACAVEALARMAEAGSGMDAATASLLADGIANGREVVTYDEPVDMSAYDEVFSSMGGGADA